METVIFINDTVIFKQIQKHIPYYNETGLYFDLMNFLFTKKVQFCMREKSREGQRSNYYQWKLYILNYYQNLEIGFW